MIDREGYRPNVGIILFNSRGKLFWARRIREDVWQFPQGGIDADESPEQALYRELAEETGLTPDDVELVGETRDWLRYRLPPHLIRHRLKPLCIGQKQRWFLLKLIADEKRVCLDQSNKPEFDNWRWVDPALPANEVVFFKQAVYRRALKEFLPLIEEQKQNSRVVDAK